MIRKIIIAEDHQSASISLQKTLEELNIRDTDIVNYCDDAFQRIKHNSELKHPYDLLITDLHFQKDHHIQEIPNGIALIAAIKKTQPELKILVFSAEVKPAIINMLFDSYNIDGYVRKARHDAEELKVAIKKIEKNEIHKPHDIVQIKRHQHAFQFTKYDITLITLLAEGVPQKNIPSYLKEHNITPSGLSSVEKRLNHIRESLQFYKNEQLVAFCKEIGLF